MWCTATAAFMLLLACWISGARCSAHLHSTLFPQSTWAIQWGVVLRVHLLWLLEDQLVYLQRLTLELWPGTEPGTLNYSLLKHICTGCSIDYGTVAEVVQLSTGNSIGDCCHLSSAVIYVQHAQQTCTDCLRAVSQLVRWKTEPHMRDQHINALMSLDILATLLGNSARV